MKISVLTAALLTLSWSENGKSIEALKEKNRSLEEEAAGLRLRLSEQDALLSEKASLLSELEENKKRFSEFRDTVIKKIAKGRRLFLAGCRKRRRFSHERSRRQRKGFLRRAQLSQRKRSRRLCKRQRYKTDFFPSRFRKRRRGECREAKLYPQTRVR